MDAFTIFWLCWGGLFAVGEGTAVATKYWHGTLSDTIQRWIGEKGHQTGWSWTRRIGLLIGMIILALHFSFGLGITGFH